MSDQIQRRPMTLPERTRAQAIGLTRMPGATWAKRFSRELRERVLGAGADGQPPLISEREAAALVRLCWTFRRQLGDALVPNQKERSWAVEVRDRPRPGQPAAPPSTPLERLRRRKPEQAAKYERALQGRW